MQSAALADQCLIATIYRLIVFFRARGNVCMAGSFFDLIAVGVGNMAVWMVFKLLFETKWVNTDRSRLCGRNRLC